jgi:hypothetical protein
MTPNDPQQDALWSVIYATLRPKSTDASPNGCLNRLANERLTPPRIVLNPATAVVREESWDTEKLRLLDPKHRHAHDFEDNRPIVVVELGQRWILVDGNHRVARWLSIGSSANTHSVLIISHRSA